MTDDALKLDFRSVDEADPGPRWQALFEEFWPAYRRWFLRDGAGARPRYAACRRELERHLAELVPVYDRLVELAGGSDLAARFLSLYRPPALVRGCTQAVWCRDEIALVRNYDYAPHLCDGVVLRSAWRGTPVIATTDCLWGALDGLNAHGLAVALAFGGRAAVGEGFGAAIALRHLLETCSTTAEAVRALERVPVHMAYNVAIVDRGGMCRTAYVGPDRRLVVRRRAASANHQLHVEWPEYARFTDTEERVACVDEALADGDATLETLIRRFLEPPLFRRAYRRASGTLYTAVYYPRRGVAEYRWRGHRWSLSFDAFPEMVHVARYVEEEGTKGQRDKGTEGGED